METLINPGTEATQSQSSVETAQAQSSSDTLAQPQVATASEPKDLVEPKAASETVKAEKDQAQSSVNYDALKADPNSQISEDHIANIRSYAKSKGLSEEQSKELIARESAAIKIHQQAQAAQLEKDAAKWAEASRVDPEIGGEKFNASLQLAKRALERVGNPQLVSFLEASKLGNHPEVIKLFVRVGSLFQEDRAVNARTNSVKQTDIGELFYGHKNN